MSGSEGSSDHSAAGEVPAAGTAAVGTVEKKKEKARVSRTSMILWHAHQNDAAAVRKLLEEDRTLVQAKDYDNRSPLHVAALHGWIDVAKTLIEYGADVNAQDRWKNTPLADAEGAKKHSMIELLKSYGGLSYGQNGSHFEPRPVPPPLPNKCDWEIEPSELDFKNSATIGKGSFGEILKACWRGTPVAVKRILPNLSDDRLVIGMAYLHNEPNVVIHRDLKPRNVLLVNSSADHLKVGDFGLSKLIRVQNSHDVYKMTGETGSYRYMAPEVFKHRKYDKKVDVFSFAMILYEMLEGDPPLSHYEPYDAAKYVAEGHRPMFRSKGFTPELRELVEQCWAADMNQRPSFLEILKRLEKIKDNLPTDHHWHLFTS
ncbi:serine/threonine-protein kinase VIK isoform X3 [Coffea arabica]|uniref:Serine/threonine-protein kinase VIK isoform X3 n=1 Tax=Coffea arabica TaxID=13443 RepID=A0ABM4W6Z5_COFAR